MRDYIDQFYNEGLAPTFYLKPVKLLSKWIKNKTVLNIFTIIIKVLYTVLVLIFAWYIFWIKYPL